MHSGVLMAQISQRRGRVPRATHLANREQSFFFFFACSFVQFYMSLDWPGESRGEPVLVVG